jgi:hypothetical protein
MHRTAPHRTAPAVAAKPEPLTTFCDRLGAGRSEYPQQAPRR